jgi:hypothetical protein
MRGVMIAIAGQIGDRHVGVGNGGAISASISAAGIGIGKLPV